jgi:osmoprotectant transport system ATP-binding protein
VHLDPISREKLQDDLIELQQKIKKTIVFVTHDIEEAMKLGDRICLMNEGKVEQIDTPEGFMTNPQSDFVKQFMGSHLERDTRNIKLRDVINHDVEQVDELNNEYPTLDGEATIKDAYAYLAQHPAVIVTNQQNNQQHILKREDMFNYLAEAKGGSN